MPSNPPGTPPRSARPRRAAQPQRGQTIPHQTTGEDAQLPHERDESAASQKPEATDPLARRSSGGGCPALL